MSNQNIAKSNLSLLSWCLSCIPRRSEPPSHPLHGSRTSDPLPPAPHDEQQASNKTSFLSCPIEVQWEILSYILVVPALPPGLVQGIAINNGARITPQPALSLVNRAIRQLTREVELECNRVTIIGDPKKNLAWLNAQPPHLLRKIRQLDLTLTEAQITTVSTKVLDGWDELVAKLAQKLLLERLHLCIDGGLYYHIIIQNRYNLEYLEPVYDTIIAPFHKPGRGFKACKDFFVYWPLWHRLEEVAECRVMGRGYDSLQRGKIDHTKRDPLLPHSLEYELLDTKPYLVTGTQA